MKDIILMDIDGTLANCDHRLHLLRRETIDWNEFEGQCEYDLPIQATAEMARMLVRGGKSLWLWTGRTVGVEAMTKIWLERHSIPYHQLLMRPAGTFLNAASLKKRWLNDSPVPKERVICAFEDEPRIVEMLTGEGLTVFHVCRPEPEFE